MRLNDEERSLNDVIETISDEGVFSEDQISALTNYANEIDNLIRIKLEGFASRNLR